MRIARATAGLVTIDSSTSSVYFYLCWQGSAALTVALDERCDSDCGRVNLLGSTLAESERDVSGEAWTVSP